VAENYLALSRGDRLEALGVAATRSGRPVHLLEKDIWVVWTLDALFSSEFGRHLVFKGGTSLSKGYGIIGRFSEDIDVTYDVRALIPELAGDGTPPKTNSQARKWRDTIDEKLPAWVRDTVVPAIQKHAAATEVDVKVSATGADIYIDYEPLSTGTGYVAPRVKIEFGARSTGEPCEERPITCDAAEHLPELQFPTARPRVMLPKRTFWEKATAVHVFCKQKAIGDRLSRHWHDLVRLDDAGYAQEALDDRALAKEIAEFKAKFFREKGHDSNQIDYMAAVSGNLQLVPDDAETLKALEVDYEKMADEGILLDDAEPFAGLIARCADLQQRANAKSEGASSPSAKQS
jgi:Nucleotidyl transferase AbiEii toxin, Type IV TA system